MVGSVKPRERAAAARIQSRGVFVFDTYVGAAVRANELGLLDNAGLKSVMDEAKEELSRIAFDDPAMKAAREAELSRDLEAANAILLAS